MLWVSLIPPFLVLALGLWTRRIALSLFVGLCTAALIAQNFSLLGAGKRVADLLLGNLNVWTWVDTGSFWKCDNLLIFVFVIFSGLIVEMIKESRGIAACIALTQKRLKTRKDAETASLIFSHILMVDDYLSTLTVGSVMRSLTDKVRVPRVKLAYLVDSMGCPLALMCPVSSWAAAIVGFLTESGVSASRGEHTLLLSDPGKVYFGILPFLFYSIVLIASTWFTVRMGLSFSSMRRREALADATGDLGINHKYDHTQTAMTDTENLGRWAIMDFLIPVCLLAFVSLGCILSGIPFQGALFTAGLSCTVISAIYYLVIGEFGLKRLGELAWEGFKLMLPAVIILLLAWTMGDVMRDDLQTGKLLADAIGGRLPLYLLPATFFLICATVAFALGTAWGTSAVMIPIAIPMTLAITGQSVPLTPAEVPIIFIIFGAILSGSVCGDHLSLISDTSIMTTTSTQCVMIDHIKTQLIYCLPAVLGAAVSFLVAGLMHTHSSLVTIACISSAAGIAVSLTGLWLANKYAK